jgi:hypothetical protein
MKKIFSGIDFRLTNDAARKISSVLTDGSAHGMVPLISWIYGDSSQNEFIPGPTLGMDNPSNLPAWASNYYVVDELKIPIVLDAARVSECKSKILDFRAGRFVLLYEDEI